MNVAILTSRRGPVVAASGLVLLLSACTGGPPPAPAPGPSGSVSASAAVTPGPTTSAISEPTTTNTLPPPPRPTGPAPSTAGRLSAASLPVPKGWKTAALPGGDEQGYKGNGTWVQARDPRYAAQDVITIGCAAVTRDDYTDPSAALEGNYVSRTGAPGVGLVLDFVDEAAATRFFTLYGAQVQACAGTKDNPPLRTTIISDPTVDADGLIDQRSYDDSEWTEVGRRVGKRITLIILSDPGHAISTAVARRILDQIGG